MSLATIAIATLTFGAAAAGAALLALPPGTHQRLAYRLLLAWCGSLLGTMVILSGVGAGIVL